jgi:hypothetical protein
MRAHVQNSVNAVSPAVPRITIDVRSFPNIAPSSLTPLAPVKGIKERHVSGHDAARSATVVRYAPMFRFIFKLLRAAFIAVLGTALAAKLLLESNAEPTTEEIDLVSIFEGQNLRSTADPFYGGKVMAMFGGVIIDLREATPAPTGVYLDVVVALGGVSLVVPEGWRVRFDGRIMLGGFQDETRTTADEDVPTVSVTGLVFMGGVQATTKSPAQTTAV